jgi:flagellar motor switch protein FliG
MKYFTYLANIGAEQLFQAIHKEHAQTIAIILVHVDTDVVADILNMFPNDSRADIAIRMSQLDTVPDMLIKTISDTLKGKISSAKGIKLGRIKAVADILKHLDKKDND